MKPDDIRAIRKAYKIKDNRNGGASIVIELAKKYKISQETVRNIAHYKTHGSVRDE